MSDSDTNAEIEKVYFTDFNKIDLIVDQYHFLLHTFPYLFDNIKSTDFTFFIENIPEYYLPNFNTNKFEKWVLEFKQEIDAICFYINKIRCISTLDIQFFLYSGKN